MAPSAFFSQAKKRLTREKTKLHHLRNASNEDVVEYCLTLVDAKFAGETSNKVDRKTDKTEVKREINLGSLLQSMDVEVREKGDDFTGEEEKFMEYLMMVIKLRQPKHTSKEEFETKMLKDKDKFVEILKQRAEPSEILHEKHNSYWGTRQQLRFGKVVGDWIDTDYGQLDAIFGILLSPTGGRTGPGDDTCLHWMLFDNSGPLAYHSAVHDAFGYLLTYHYTGPGYQYLEAASIFRKDNPLSGQVAGIRFWRKVLEHHKAKDLKKHIF